MQYTNTIQQIPQKMQSNTKLGGGLNGKKRCF